jgi:hypothetical protein
MNACGLWCVGRGSCNVRQLKEARNIEHVVLLYMLNLDSGRSRSIDMAVLLLAPQLSSTSLSADSQLIC